MTKEQFVLKWGDEIPKVFRALFVLDVLALVDEASKSSGFTPTWAIKELTTLDETPSVASTASTVIDTD